MSTSSSLGDLLGYSGEESSSSDEDDGSPVDVYAALTASRPPATTAKPQQRRRKRKRVSWAPGGNLTQVFLFDKTETSKATLTTSSAMPYRSFSSESLFRIQSPSTNSRQTPKVLTFQEKRLEEQRLHKSQVESQEVKPVAASASPNALQRKQVQPKPVQAKAVLLELFCDECDVTIPPRSLRYDCNKCDHFFCLCTKCYADHHQTHEHLLIPNVSVRHITEPVSRT